MAGQQLQTTAFILTRQPSGADSFEQLTAFSGEDGLLHCLRRMTHGKNSSSPIDLFDEAELWLDSSNQGRTWFIKEHRLVQRHDGIGRSYDALCAAAALASLISRNTVSDESRPAVITLLRASFSALASGGRPDITWLKTLYRFLRDEGYPVKQHWWPALAANDRETAAQLLNQPLAAQTVASKEVARLTLNLEQWIKTETEIRLR